MLNVVSLMGRVVARPELKTTQSNIFVTSFTLAVPRNQDETDFIDIVAWRKTAEFAASHLDKGKLIALTGRLQIRNWQDKEGANRRSAEVVASNIYFAEKRTESRPESLPETFTEITEDDAELPF